MTLTPQHVCPHCLRHIRYVPMPAHLERCPARLAGQEAHSAVEQAFAQHAQAALVAAGQKGGGR